MHWCKPYVCLLTLSACLCCDNSPAGADGVAAGGDVSITLCRLRWPGERHDVEQASGLHYGRVGQREGLWVVCDRNGGASAGKLFFISKPTLSRAVHEGVVVADEVFAIAPPEQGWEALAAGRDGVKREVVADVRERVRAGLTDEAGPRLDLEAVTIAPSPTPPHEPRVFVGAEEPYSVVLELALEGQGESAQARLTAMYRYQEAEEEHGTDRNDGLEGLAYGGRPGSFYWVEEGTKFHDGPPGPRLFFLEPRLGRADLTRGRVVVERPISDALTAAVHGQRQGRMQTLNALTLVPDGRLLAVDRNGGWILRVDPETRTATRWVNLYDLGGTNLREALAEFPGPRHMPYISIEGIAVDEAGTLWLVDDPAMPEGFRASALLRVRGLDVGTPRPAP